MSGRRVIALVLIASAAAGCSATGAPVRAVPPSVAPSAKTMSSGGGHACFTPGISSDDRQKGLVSVGRHPTALIVLWLPGLNQQPCRTALTRENAATARRLAEDIRKAPKAPSGNFNCPGDSGTRARLYFGHDGTADLADLRFGGCRNVSAPGRSARELTRRLARDLAPIAPSPWNQYLGL